MDIGCRKAVGRKKGAGTFSYLIQIRKIEMHESNKNKSEYEWSGRKDLDIWLMADHLR